MTKRPTMIIDGTRQLQALIKRTLKDRKLYALSPKKTGKNEWRVGVSHSCKGQKYIVMLSGRVPTRQAVRDFAKRAGRPLSSLERRTRRTKKNRTSPLVAA